MGSFFVAIGAVICIVGIVIGINLYFKGFQNPPVGMSEEGKRKFNNSTGLGAWIGIFIVATILMILQF